MGEEKSVDTSQLREKFALEAKARLRRLNGGLVYFEKNPGDKKLEGDILREAHELNRSSRTLGFAKISELSRMLEEVLTRRRDKAILANQDLTDALFVTLDTLSRLVDALALPPRVLIEIESVLDRLKLAQVPTGAIFAHEGPFPAPPAPSSLTPSSGPVSPHSGYDDLGPGTEVDLARLESISNLLANAVSHHEEELELRKRIGELVAEGKPAFQEDAPRRSELKCREAAATAALSRDLEELRSEVTVLRTVPLLPLFDSLQRMAGALATELGKEVEVLVRGGKTRIDRKVAEALTGPMTHILRNAVDHGIGVPSERERAGKSRKGRIVITATPENGWVVLEVEDDGRGIEPNEVREAAIRKGMIDEKTGYRMDDRELIDFVFHTGFSTAKTMNRISGLGIGMEVVRAMAERFNGTTEVHSDSGKGTRLVVKLPMNPVAEVPPG